MERGVFSQMENGKYFSPPPPPTSSSLISSKVTQSMKQGALLPPLTANQKRRKKGVVSFSTQGRMIDAVRKETSLSQQPTSPPHHSSPLWVKYKTHIQGLEDGLVLRDVKLGDCFGLYYQASNISSQLDSSSMNDANSVDISSSQSAYALFFDIFKNITTREASLASLVGLLTPSFLTWRYAKVMKEEEEGDEWFDDETEKSTTNLEKTKLQDIFFNLLAHNPATTSNYENRVKERAKKLFLSFSIADLVILYDWSLREKDLVSSSISSNTNTTTSNTNTSSNTSLSYKKRIKLKNKLESLQQICGWLADKMVSKQRYLSSLVSQLRGVSIDILTLTKKWQIRVGGDRHSVGFMITLNNDNNNSIGGGREGGRIRRSSSINYLIKLSKDSVSLISNSGFSKIINCWTQLRSVKHHQQQYRDMYGLGGSGGRGGGGDALFMFEDENEEDDQSSSSSFYYFNPFLLLPSPIQSNQTTAYQQVSTYKIKMVIFFIASFHSFHNYFLVFGE